MQRFGRTGIVVTTRHIAASTNKALFGKRDGVVECEYDFCCPNLGAVRESDMTSATDVAPPSGSRICRSVSIFISASAAPAELDRTVLRSTGVDLHQISAH